MAHRAAPLSGDAKVETDIVETAISDGNLQTLVSALQAAGLVETLKGKGPFTVSAPTHEALAKIDAATLEGLTTPESKAKMAAIRKCQVVKGRGCRDQAGKAGEEKTMRGSGARIVSRNEKVLVNGARLIKPDSVASIGVIHVIDEVIMPKWFPGLAQTKNFGLRDAVPGR